MSFQERVTPGKVNNLISFFEKQGDETSNANGHHKEHFRESRSSSDKQGLISDFFGSKEHAVYHSQDRRSAPVDIPQECHSSQEPSLNGTSQQQSRRRSSSEEEDSHPRGEEEGIQVTYHSEPVQIVESEDYVFSNQVQRGGEIQEVDDERLEKIENMEAHCDRTTREFDSLRIQHVDEEVDVVQGENVEEEVRAEECLEEADPHQQVGYPNLQQMENVEELHEGNQSDAPYDLPDHLKGYGTPTVHPCGYCDPAEDAGVLKKALKGLGTDEAAVVGVLCARSLSQRRDVIASYEELFQKDLVKELQKELSGRFEEIVVAMVTPPFEYLAKELKRAVKGLGTDEDALIEILCAYDDSYIQEIKNAYETLFKRCLKDDVYEDTSGDFRKILLTVLSCSRQDPQASPASVAAQLCDTDAKGRSSVDCDTLRTVLVSYTRTFLYCVFVEYEHLCGRSFGDLIQEVFKGDARDALLAIYQSIVSLAGFFAIELDKSFKGIGTKDSKLIRIIVSRSELDLEDVKQEYERLFQKSLEKQVTSETSGDYRATLISLIQGCNREDKQQQIAESNL